jgi:branched-chain amino acid transport system substrate-binding protein
MKRWVSITAIVVLCLALVIGVACGGGEKEEGVKEVKLGYATALSGFLGTIIGLPAQRGVELANEQIGVFAVGGEQCRWKIIFEDNAYTTSGGLATATKFIYEDGVKLMRQSGADSGMTAQVLCEGEGVLLDASAGLDFLGPNNPYSIYLDPLYQMPLPSFFRWLVTAHPEVKTVAIVQGDDLTGHGIADSAEKSAEYYGFEVVAKEFIPAGTTELFPLATKLVAKDPDLIVGGLLVMTPMQEMGWHGLIVDAGWSEVVGEYAGWDNVQGVLIWAQNPFGEELPQAVKDFKAEYEEQYNEELTGGPFWAYIRLNVLTDILKKAGTVDDMDRILEVIEAGTHFDTPLGPLGFGGGELVGINHLLLWPVWILEIRDHEPHIVEWVDSDEVYELACEVYGDLYLPK